MRRAFLACGCPSSSGFGAGRAEAAAAAEAAGFAGSGPIVPICCAGSARCPSSALRAAAGMACGDLKSIAGSSATGSGLAAARARRLTAENLAACAG